MSRKKNAFWGFTYDIIGQIVTTALSFLAIPIIISQVSDVNYGYWITIGSIMTWLAISDFGIGIALSRHLIKAFNQNEQKNSIEINTLISSAFYIFLVGSLIFLLLAFVIYPYSLNWFKITNDILNQYKAIYFISVLAGSLALPASLFNSILEALQKLSINRNISTLTNFINIIISIVLIFFFKSIISLSIALLISILLKIIISIYYSTKYLNYKISIKYFTRDKARILFNFGGYFQLGKIANTVATNTDAFFITKYLGANLVTQYSFTIKLYQTFAISLASKIPTAIFSGISQLIEIEDFEKLNRVIKVLYSFLLRIALFFMCLCLFYNDNFIELWVGKNYYAGQMVNIILVYLIFYETLIRGLTVIIYSFGELKIWSVITIIESILNIFLSIILISKFKIAGLLMATALSRTFTSGLFLLYFMIKKKIFDKSYFKNTFIIFLKSSPVFMLLFFTNRFIFLTSWLELFGIFLFSLFVNIISFDLSVIYKYRKMGFRYILNSILKT